MIKSPPFVLLSILSGMLPALGVEAPDHGFHPGCGALMLALDVGKTRNSLYEPILIEYTVTNPTSRTIESAVEFSSNKSLSVTIVPAAGPPFPERAWWIDDTIRVGPTVHPPGESVTSTVDLLWNYNTRSLTFAAPGKYTIEAALTGCPVGLIKARPVEITIEDPSSLDRAAIAFLGSAETLVDVLHQGVGSYCMNQRNKEQECYARMRGFVDEFGASAYAPAVTARLANWLLFLAGRKGDTAHDAASIQAYRADVRVVLDMADRFLERFPDHPEAARIRWTRIEALDKVGTPGQLRESLTQFMEMYPGRRSQFESLRQQLNVPLPDGASHVDVPR